MTEQDLARDVALVTGSARGIGAAVAQELGERGAKVIVADLGAGEVAQQVARLTALGLQAHGVMIDIANPGSVAAAAARVADEHGDLSILVNNASIARAARIEDEQALSLWHQVVEVNLTGTFQVISAFVEQLKRTQGKIVNILSVAALRSSSNAASYAASKGGVHSLTQSLAVELAPHSIRVNAVAPGYMNAPMGRKGEEAEQWVQWHVPMKRFGEPHEVAGAVSFLVSPKASYVNGATLPVDGGYLVV